MRFSILLLTALILFAGCQPAPRYRTGPVERRDTSRPAERRGRYTTNDYLRLGTIMRSYLGKPYLGKSRRERGVDCSLFTQEVFKKSDSRMLPRTAAEQYEEGTQLRRGQLSYGDLVFFKTDYKPVSHVGIYMTDGQFIHASTSSGVIISNLSEKYWGQRYIGARRILDGKPSRSNR